MTQSPLQLPCCSREVMIYCRSVSAVNSHPPAADSAALEVVVQDVTSRLCLLGPSQLPSHPSLWRLKAHTEPFLPCALIAGQEAGVSL